MASRGSLMLLSVAALALVACTENPTEARSLLVGTGSKSVNAGAIEFAPLKYQEPAQLVASDAGTELIVREARLGTPGAPAPNILYWSGSVIRDIKTAAIYYGASPVYNNGPQPGTAGSATADGSLVGHFLRNIGGTPYWNINSTYFQNQGTNTQYVNNTMQYAGFWAANAGPGNLSAPVSGEVVTQNRMAALIEEGFATPPVGGIPRRCEVVAGNPLLESKWARANETTSSVRIVERLAIRHECRGQDVEASFEWRIVVDHKRERIGRRHAHLIGVTPESRSNRGIAQVLQIELRVRAREGPSCMKFHVRPKL